MTRQRVLRQGSDGGQERKGMRGRCLESRWKERVKPLKSLFTIGVLAVLAGADPVDNDLDNDTQLLVHSDPLPAIDLASPIGGAR